MTLALAVALLVLAIILAWLAYLWRALETAHLEIAELDAVLARLAEPLPPRERVERRRVAR